MNEAEPSIALQVRNRALLIGRHDYWPGYTVEVIKNLDYDYWPQLALSCDALKEQREKDRQELNALRARQRG